MIAKEEVMSMLTKKRKATSTPAATAAPEQLDKKAKKLKTDHSSISNGDDKQSVVDCRQIPFQGIQA